MSTDVTRYFASAHGETDQCYIVKIQVQNQAMQIGRERIIVVSVPRLGRLAESTAIIRDYPITGFH
ncbi:hypothetical protein D3C74_499520 [compost metagenome]